MMRQFINNSPSLKAGRKLMVGVQVELACLFGSKDIPLTYLELGFQRENEEGGSGMIVSLN